MIGQAMKEFARTCDRVSGHWSAILVFNALLLLLFWAKGLDFANFYISIVTAELVVLTAGANRASNIAVHAKLDRLIRDDEKADDALLRAEELDEQAIEARR